MTNGKPLTVRAAIAQLRRLPPDSWLVGMADPEGNGYHPITAVEEVLYEPGPGFRGGDLWGPPGKYVGDEFVPDDPAAPVPAHVKLAALMVAGYDPRE